MKMRFLSAVALIAATFPSIADAVDFRSPENLPRQIFRYGAKAEVTFKVVDTDGKPVQGVSVCGVETDASGTAVYHGVVVGGRLQVTVSSKDVYSPAVAPVAFSSLSDDRKSFVPTNVPPIVVRRKVKPHAMRTGSIGSGSFVRDRPLVIRRETEWFGVEFGMFPGVSDSSGYCNLRSGYFVLEPKTPEDGFQEIEDCQDSLGTPLVAPREGYVTGPFELMFRVNDRDRHEWRRRIVAFRHKTPGGFVYGIVRSHASGMDGLEYRVNYDADELSLEPEDRR